MSEEAGTTFEQDDSGDLEPFFILETPSRPDRRQSASGFTKSSFVHSEDEVSAIAPIGASEPVRPKTYLRIQKKK